MLIRLRICSVVVLLLASGYQCSVASQISKGTGDAEYRELQARLKEQKQATDAGDSTAVAEASKRLSAFALLEIARAKAEEGNWSQSADLYKQSLAIEDRSDARSELAAATRTSHGKLTSLTPIQVKVLKSQERDLSGILANGFNDWGTAEARMSEDEKALHHFQEAERWNASTPGLMNNLGLVAFRMKDFPESARAFRAVLAHSPQDVKVRLFLGISLFSIDEFAEAAKAFAPISDVALEDPRSAYAMIYSLARSNQQAHANQLLDKVTEQDTPTEVLNLLCQIYNTTENYEHSAACFRRVYQRAPNTPRAHYQVAVALVRLDRPTEAIPELRLEQQITPDDPDVEYQLAYALLQTSQKEEAVTLLRKVVAQKPDHAQAQYELGKVLLEQGDVTGAMTHLELAAHSDNSKDYIHYQLQSAYRRAGRTADADRELAVYRTIKAQHREIPASAH
jgi:tetratricopeptide (TPR) repeat protein